MTAHEVKGVWFITARAEVESTFGRDALEVLVESVPAPHRKVIAEPLTSEWYPEEALQACLRSLRMDLMRGESARFGRFLEGCTERGVGTFFSALLRISTPRFVLSQVPTMWRHIRRGPGHVEVEHGERETTLRYRAFPFFDDPIYEELTVASVGAVVRVCTRTDPDITVARVTDHSLDLRVRY